MKNEIDQPCMRCGRTTDQVKLYRDPFGHPTAPGQWPTLTMHSDCFLAYIGERKSIGVSRPRP